MRPRIVIGVLCSILILGCSANKENRFREGHYARDYVYAEEINRISAPNAFVIITKLRPHWLSPRPNNLSLSYPVIYLDGMRYGSINELSTIPSSDISTIQYFNYIDAFIRFGPGNPAGAILVTTK